MPPVPVLGSASLRALESHIPATGSPSLMERAGAAVAEAARALADDSGAPILIVAGPGNNGGDAWVAAARLRRSFHAVNVLDATGAAPAADAARAGQAEFRAAGGVIVREWPAHRPALVIDGLLGLGLTRDVDGGFRALVERMNAAGAPILAIDVPSGLDSATGCVRGVAVRATATLTLIAHKVGLHTGEGLDCSGSVRCDDLGLGSAVVAEPHGILLDARTVAAWLGPRPRNSHKGRFGTLAVVGGQRGMVGAALLAARAGLLAGAGKVYVGLLAADAPGVDAGQPELMIRGVDDALGADVIVAGPGAGRSLSATSVSMFERSVLPALIASPRALVLDADALNTLAVSDSLARSLAMRAAPTLLTPHPAEAGRLLGTDAAAVQRDRLGAACTLAQRFRAHVVVKGAGSICATPDGKWAINTTGNPGLASGGTGDVLAGIVGALLCQGLDPEHALQYAVCLHGAAADACVARGIGPVGLTASEVALEARSVLNAWIGGPFARESGREAS
jgi:ADP-dependent NAD(P)H-hydrate dehydratase / NAD(P)H-hydrate epimerase